MAIYNREAAVRYANTYWNSYNPQFQQFKNNCTNFISQCLWAGGIPMTRSSNPSVGWWYRRGSWSYSWAVAHSLYLYLQGNHQTGPRAVKKSSSKELQLGDIICYDWNGDGRWNHNAIITAFNTDGEPLVNAQTHNSQYRYWAYRDSTAWTPQIQYAFFHIVS